MYRSQNLNISALSIHALRLPEKASFLFLWTSTGPGFQFLRVLSCAFAGALVDATIILQNVAKFVGQFGNGWNSFISDT